MLEFYFWFGFDFGPAVVIGMWFEMSLQICEA